MHAGAQPALLVTLPINSTLKGAAVQHAASLLSPDQHVLLSTSAGLH